MERLDTQGIEPFECLFQRNLLILGSGQFHDAGVDSMLFPFTMLFPAYEHSTPKAPAFHEPGLSVCASTGQDDSHQENNEQHASALVWQEASFGKSPKEIIVLPQYAPLA